MKVAVMTKLIFRKESFTKNPELKNSGLNNSFICSKTNLKDDASILHNLRIIINLFVRNLEYEFIG